MAGGYEGQQVIADVAALVTELADGDAVVFGGPGDDSVGEQCQAPGLFGLVLQVGADDGVLLGVVQVPAQRV